MPDFRGTWLRKSGGNSSTDRTSALTFILLQQSEEKKHV